MESTITGKRPDGPIHNLKGEIAISKVLRVGAGLSTIIMIAGVLLVIIRGTGPAANGVHFVRLLDLPNLLLQFDPGAVTELGILLLLLTPVARIVISVIEFAVERDLKYVLISLGVLAVVLFSIAFAIEA